MLQTVRRMSICNQMKPWTCHSVILKMYGFSLEIEKRSDGGLFFMRTKVAFTTANNGFYDAQRRPLSIVKAVFNDGKGRHQGSWRRPLSPLKAVITPKEGRKCCTHWLPLDVMFSITGSCACTLFLGLFPSEDVLFWKNGLLKRQRKSRCKPQARFSWQTVHGMADAMQICVCCTLNIPFRV